MEINNKKIQDLIVAVAEDGSFYFHGDALMIFAATELGSGDCETLKKILGSFAPEEKKYFIRFKPSEIAQEF